MADQGNATVIDSLIVTLGLDPTNYDTGRKAAAADLLKFREGMAQTAKNAAIDGKKAGSFFGQIKQEALGLFAVVVGARGLETFTANTVTNLAAAGRAAKLMGLGVSDLVAFQNLIVRSGGSADAAKASLQGLAQAMEQWRVTGNTPMLPWLNRVGASANDDPLKVYEKFAKFAETHDAKQSNLVGQNLGLDEVSIRKALDGAKAFREGMAESYRLGVPTDAQVAKVTALQKAFLTLRQAVTGTGQSLVEDVAPALTTVLDFVADGIKKFPELTKAVLALGAALTVVGAAKIGAGVLSLIGGGAAAGGATAGAAAGGATAGAAAEVAGATLAAAGGGKLAAGAAERAAARAAAARLALIGAIQPWAAVGGGVALSLIPSDLNKGEAADLARARAQSRPNAATGSTDLDYAVRTLIGEARPGDQRGQMDVAHVIKNRMNATGRGAADIVLQHGQFEPWGDDATRKRLMAINPNSPAYQQARASWLAAMNEVDPTNGAKMFVSPEGQAAKGRKMPSWAKSDALTLSRGGHQFYRGDFPGGSRTASNGAPATVPQGGAAVAATATPTSITNQITVGDVTINTPAKDTRGIARDFVGEVRRQGLAIQANTGLE